MANKAFQAEDYEEEDLEETEEESVEEEEVETTYSPRRRQESGPRGGAFRQAGRGARFRPRRKVCSFCVDKVKEISYKDVGTLQRFLDDHAKILPRRKTGTCAKHQRRLALAVKQARHLALLSFTGRRTPYS